jgi:hypothetical protein
MQEPIETRKKSSKAQILHTDIISLLHRAESVSVLNPFSAYSKLRAISKMQQELSVRLDKLHDQYRDSLNAGVSGYGSAPVVGQTRIVGEGLSALLQVERAWQNLGSEIDRKYAYSFGFFALYVALISLIATIVFGIASLM